MKRQFSKTTFFDALMVCVAFAMTATTAHFVYKMQDTWPGVTPAPSESTALFYGVGDRQLSYRTIGLVLQNAGDMGGRTTNFKDYNYATLEKWFWLSDRLDHAANYVPSLAAYYFGAAKKKKQLRHLLDYLAHVGSDPDPAHGERWRWLAHATFLARFKVKDMDKSLELANQLAALPNPDLPEWAHNMPGYVRSARGEKREARDLFMLTIADPRAQAKQTEINQSCWYIENNLREPGDGLDSNPLYQELCAQYIKEKQQKSLN